jgi:hypothetical protein
MHSESPSYFMRLMLKCSSDSVFIPLAILLSPAYVVCDSFEPWASSIFVSLLGLLFCPLLFELSCATKRLPRMVDFEMYQVFCSVGS